VHVDKKNHALCIGVVANNIFVLRKRKELEKNFMKQEHVLHKLFLRLPNPTVFNCHVHVT
jgi:hypothetical protein